MRETSRLFRCFVFAFLMLLYHLSINNSIIKLSRIRFHLHFYSLCTRRCAVFCVFSAGKLRAGLVGRSLAAAVTAALLALRRACEACNYARMIMERKFISLLSQRAHHSAPKGDLNSSPMRERRMRDITQKHKPETHIFFGWTSFESGMWCNKFDTGFFFIFIPHISLSPWRRARISALSRAGRNWKFSIFDFCCFTDSTWTWFYFGYFFGEGAATLKPHQHVSYVLREWNDEKLWTRHWTSPQMPSFLSERWKLLSAETAFLEIIKFYMR